MKQSLIYLLLFALGVVLALLGWIPGVLLNDDISKWILYGLLFFVGIQIGSSKNMFTAVKRFGWRITLVPIATTVGTFAGVALISLLLPNRSLSDCLSVGVGFAYYSLSSILITEYKGIELGTIALLANISREIITLLFAPLMVKYFGKLAPIAGGGATTMDTTFPIIIRTSGKEFSVASIYHGFVMDLSVPFLVTLCCSI